MLPADGLQGLALENPGQEHSRVLDGEGSRTGIEKPDGTLAPTTVLRLGAPALGGLGVRKGRVRSFSRPSGFHAGG